MLNVGIVGLPNVGKSTLFTALTKKQVDAANFPFCTIEPNVGTVEVPDHRLDQLAEISKAAKIIPTAIEFVDIAGLVKGASEGEGLGNKFLSNIRETDMILHVVRSFENTDITHVEGSVDPERDVEVIETELMLADLATVEKRLNPIERKAATVKDAESVLNLDKGGRSDAGVYDSEFGDFIFDLNRELTRYDGYTAKTIDYEKSSIEEIQEAAKHVLSRRAETPEQYAQRAAEDAAAVEGAEGEVATTGEGAEATPAKEGEAAKKDDKGKDQPGDKKQAGDKKSAPDKKTPEKKEKK